MQHMIPKGKVNEYLLGIYPKVIDEHNPGMDVQAHRKQRLRELMNLYCNGVIATLAERIDRSESYVSRMFYPMTKSGAKPIADRMSMVIESAFGLERAWLDQPLGHGIPGVQPIGSYVAEVATGGATPHPRITWPFRRVTYQRIQQLKRALGHQTAQEALTDIDKQLEIVVIKWESEAREVKRHSAA